MRLLMISNTILAARSPTNQTEYRQQQ